MRHGRIVTHAAVALLMMCVGGLLRIAYHPVGQVVNHFGSGTVTATSLLP